MNLGSKNGPLTPSLSPKGEREKTSRNLHRVQGFNARSFPGNLSPFGGEREKRAARPCRVHAEREIANVTEEGEHGLTGGEAITDPMGRLPT